MKNRRKAIWAIAAANLRQLVPAYITTAAFFLVGIYNLLACLLGWSDNFYVDMANYLYVLVVIAPIIIVTRNFRKIMYLNGSKNMYYWGTLLSYAIIATVVSLMSIVFHILTKTIFGSLLIIQSLVDVFSWWDHGFIIAFVQQFVFILMTEVFVHTLASVQTNWYGWLTDVLIALILIIFIPLPELSALLEAFFNLIIFNSNALLQIISCLLLTVILYFIYRPILNRREV